ncbi:hypothetical protein KPH14_010997 [Odynerus spinipes]|uniref:Uncharacterized protein n=1 Tax=Odynerus spinipes TaxID=1348599 RepID=A0AAD9VU28_9HYME|nr:hypothetical protein KPH14_010997 [Odynerus spinipes]
MLFLWSKEPAPDPRAGPWFAWFATAVILWRCRRRITKAILAASPLRLLRRRTASIAPVKQRASSTVTTTTKRLRQPQLQTNQLNIPMHYHHRQQQQQLQQQHKYKSTTGIKTRVKRLCTGDGPNVSPSSSSIQTNHQINYRVTRSGRIYGKYQNRTVAAEAR